MAAKKQQMVKAEPKEIVQMSPEFLISQAIDRSVPVETMERLLAMRNQIKAERAREAFNAAISEFQKLCPFIKKTKVVKNSRDGKERYRYAPLEDIISQIRDLLSGCGLNYSFDTVNSSNGDISVKCIIRHIEGHQETSTFSAPIDKDAYMNAPQKVASTHTYAKRYALCDALGILTANEDDDANVVTELASKKEEPPKDTTKNFEFLKKMGEMKEKIGEEMYRECLKFHGFQKSNQILKREDQIKVWKEMNKVAKSIKKSEDMGKEEK